MPNIEEIELFSEFLYQIRTFFRKKNFLEIETPLLNPYTTPEPYIDSYTIENYLYLTASPEFNLKIILSLYKRNVFQIAHVFRKSEKSSVHRNEFLMLEWYHLGFNEEDLILEIMELLKYLSENLKGIEQNLKFTIKSCKEIFYEFLQTDYSRKNLIEIIQTHGLVERENFKELQKETYDNLFYLVFLNLIEPKLNTENPLFLTYYPKDLRGYSKLKNQTESTRFELFWKGLEIGNGYYEINHKEEQYREFQIQFNRRLELNKPIYPISVTFLESFPLPDCSGVAIGIERLFMAFRNLKSISEISFCGLWK